MERNRGAWPSEACYASWATQAPETSRALTDIE
jgi:hypothetical protein